MTSPTSTDHQGDLLVVDDDLPSLRALSTLLAERGYTVRSARNGPSALMMTGAEPPDLILLDIQMPGMDGFQVCAALKDSPDTRHIPVILISAGDDVSDKVKSFEMGGVDYITKPFREEEALARIHTHLTLARLAVQARQAAVDAERQRLARELHDSVTQSIYSLTLLSSGWESMARQGTLQDPADSFHRLGEVGQQALREMRLLLLQLRPSILEEQGLVKALEYRLDRVELRANIDAHLAARGDLAGLPHKIEDELFNIAQEALNNSLRHARASRVQVLIAAEQGQVTLSVEDDGQGFNPGALRAGMGLGTMQERAQAIAGNLNIQSGPGGTRVSVAVPLRENESK